MRTRQLICLVLTIMVASGPFLNADEIEGIVFPEDHQFGKTRLVLNNVGLMRYNIVIKAMVAGLYLGEGVDPKRALTDVPKRIEIHYFWDLKAKDIVDASEKLLIANVSTKRLHAIRAQVDELNKLYQNVSAGDRYSLTYIPGVGTELSLNGDPKGVIEGAEFADAYFAIWLGKKPMDVSLRDQLLKRK